MPEADGPNVLYLVADQHRPDWVSTAGVPVRTPNLERLAERGAWFANAVCPSPLCGPSRACLASGMEYDRCPVPNHDHDYPPDRSTVYERLRDEAGYHTMGCGKFDLHKSSPTWGTDGQHLLAEWGFSAGVDNAGKWDAVSAGAEAPADPYMAYLYEEGLAETHLADFDRRRGGGRTDTFPTPLPGEAYCDNWIARNGLDLLADAPDGDPWFLQVNFAGPHNPWDVTEEMHGWYRDPDVTFPDPVDPPGDATREELQAVRRNYAAMVENLDRWLGRYLDRLEERGELADTLVVFTADHGELLGDHGEWLKRSPYRESAGVPLFVAGPGVEARGRTAEPASLLDLHATALDYAGLDPGDADSRSLRPYLAGETDDHRDVAYSGVGPWRLVDDGRYKLVSGYDRSRGANEQVSAFEDGETTREAVREARDPVLFDRERDPDETTDVAAENPAVVERLRRLREIEGA